jgi:hypothetical protein
VIAGSYTTDTFHGFLLSGGTYRTFDTPGPLPNRAFGLNNNGQIVGTFAGGLYGFVATPVPEPNSLVLTGIGIFVLIAYLYYTRSGVAGCR